MTDHSAPTVPSPFVRITWHQFVRIMQRFDLLNGPVFDKFHAHVCEHEPHRVELGISERLLSHLEGTPLKMVGEDGDKFHTTHAARIFFDSDEDAILFKLKYL